MKLQFGRINKRLLEDVKSQRAAILAGMACVIASAILSAAAIPVTKYSVRAIEIKDLGLLSSMCLGIIAIFAGKYWLTRGSTVYLSLASARLGLEMRNRIFSKLLQLPVSYFNRTQTGDVQSVMTNDVGLYQNSVSLMKDSIEGPIKAVGALVTVFVLQWELALLSVLAVTSMELVIRRSVRKVKAAQTRVQTSLAEYSSVTQEVLAGSRVIRALVAEDEMRARNRGVLLQIFESWMASIRTIASLKPQIEVVGAAALAAALYACGWLALNGALHVSDIAALIMALDVINQGVRAMGSVRSNHAQILAAAERIHDKVLDVPVEGDNSGEFIPKEIHGAIEFDDVSFTYPDGTQALRNVSFEIPPGTSLALVGSSGAGKSTITDLLLKFYEPTDGCIRLDGRDIAEIDSRWMRSRIGIVPQHTFLFAGSIADNLRLGDPDASIDAVRRAAALGHVDVFVDPLPSGFETTIGERGAGLSGGEMQRIAIGRALLHDPKLLILDEATSNLDAVSEQAVQEALQIAMRKRTTLIVAHRLTTAARADSIIVLSKGRVVEQGTHRALLKAQGPYAAMYAAFSSGLLEEAVI